MNLFNVLENFKPDLFFGCSHGSPTQFSGQNAQIVFTACENDERMSGSQAYFLSCLMGQTLAPSMNEKDAVTVAAYTSEFAWIINPDYTDRPLEDPYSYPFMRAIVEPSCRLLEGATWKQFYDLSVALFNEGVTEWFSSDDPSASQIVAALEHDRDCFVIYGETQIGPVSPIYGVAAPEILIPLAVSGGILLGLFVL